MKMKQIMLILAGLALLGSQIACCQITLPRVPDVEINVPTIEVGEIQDRREAIPLGETDSATVEVLFGAGELTIEAGTSDQLLSGRFRYNVERWAPQIAFEDGTLTIEQGSTRQDWGVPTGNVHNEWDLEFSPQIPLKMDLEVGAGDGRLDLTGLQLEKLGLKLGAGDFEVRFDEPNEARMSQFTLDAGASKLEVTGIGNASPERMKVQGGVGDITLDFSGAWPRSGDVQVTAGIGSVTLRLPDNVGVQVETEGGLTTVEVSGLQRSGNAYVNDVFGETETELHIQITTGIGSVRLIEVSNN